MGRLGALPRHSGSVIYRINDRRVSWRTIDDEVIAVDLDNGECLSANPTASVIWELLVEGASADAIVEVVLSCFDDATRPTVERDVAEFLDMAGARGLVEQTA